MTRVARLALTLLLAIALPLQGMAATAMIACGVGPQDHSHAVAHDHHALDPAGHADASPPGMHAAHSHGGKADLGGGTLHKCSACASCCVGAAAPTQSITFATVKLTDRFAPLVARSVPAYVSEGLERPPREFLA